MCCDNTIQSPDSRHLAVSFNISRKYHMYGKEVIKCIPSIVLLFEEHLHQHFFSNARCVQMSCMAIKTILRGNQKCELLAKSYIRKKQHLILIQHSHVCTNGKTVSEWKVSSTSLREAFCKSEIHL